MVRGVVVSDYASVDGGGKMKNWECSSSGAVLRVVMTHTDVWCWGVCFSSVGALDMAAASLKNARKIEDAQGRKKTIREWQ